MNTTLEISANGGGFKGFFRFMYGWLKCIVGKHTIIGYFDIKRTELKRYKACKYCCKVYEQNDE